MKLNKYFLAGLLFLCSSHIFAQPFYFKKQTPPYTQTTWASSPCRLCYSTAQKGLQFAGGIAACTLFLGLKAAKWGLYGTIGYFAYKGYQAHREQKIAEKQKAAAS